MWKRLLPGGVAAVLLWASPAAAQLPQEWNLCGLKTGFEGVCGSVFLQTIDADAHKYSLLLTNTGQTGLLTAVGVYSRLVEFTTTFIAPIPTGWEPGAQGLPGMDYNPKKKGFDVAINTENGINYSVKSASDDEDYGNHQLYEGFLAFTFTTDKAIHELDDLAVRWHAQAIGSGNELSYKCDSSLLDDSGYPCTAEVVPEPISMALLGTGLAGLGGFKALRRRRREGLLDPTDESLA